MPPLHIPHPRLFCFSTDRRGVHRSKQGASSGVQPSWIRSDVSIDYNEDYQRASSYVKEAYLDDIDNDIDIRNGAVPSIHISWISNILISNTHDLDAISQRIGWQTNQAM